MALQQRSLVEHFARDARVTPLAVTPELHFAQSSLGLLRREEAQRVAPARCRVVRVEQTARPIQTSARGPRSREPGQTRPSASAVINEQAERQHELCPRKLV